MIEISENAYFELVEATAETKATLNEKAEKITSLIEIADSIIDEIEQLRSEIWDCSININEKLSAIKCSVVNNEY